MSIDFRAGVDPRVTIVALVAELIEEREELVVVLLGDRIELVIVALSAGHGQAEKHLAGGLDPIDGVDGEVLLGNGAALMSDHVIAVEAGGDALRLGGVGHQVTGQLLNDKLVEGQVVVVGLDHPVAPQPHVTTAIDGKSVGVGVARLIHPRHRHALAEVRRCQQTTNRVLPRIFAMLRIVSDKCPHVLGGWRQSSEIESQSPDQSSRFSLRRGFHPFFLQSGEDKGINLILPGFELRNDRSNRRIVSPVAFILGSFFDPAFEKVLLIFRQYEVRFRRRHQLVIILGNDTPPCLAFLKISRGNRNYSTQVSSGTFERIETKIGFATVFVRPVAVKAGFRKDRANITIKLDGTARSYWNRLVC